MFVEALDSGVQRSGRQIRISLRFDLSWHILPPLVLHLLSHVVGLRYFREETTAQLGTYDLMWDEVLVIRAF